jgi:hypothetical protein
MAMSAKNPNRRSTPALPAKSTFLHVIYEHRYLAVAGHGWSVCGPGASESNRKRATSMLPQISTPVLESILVHTRNLAEFYGVPRTSKKGDEKNIRVVDFSLGRRVSARQEKSLERLRRAIEVHVLHCTAWRDPSFRRSQKAAGTTEALQRARPNWNKTASSYPTKIFAVLDYASAGAGDWAVPFRLLHEACVARLASGTYEWPAELAEARDVLNYLTVLGL